MVGRVPPARRLALAIALATLAGCAAPPAPPEPQRAEEEPEPEVRVVAAPASDLLGFARWVESASEEELRAARSRLEPRVADPADRIAPFRLALVLHAPRAAEVDAQRARQLLARFLRSAVAPQDADLRNLATVLMRAWHEHARLTRALHESELQAAQRRAALERERERRALAEQRLDALIKVERRVKRSNEPVREVKPVAR